MAGHNPLLKEGAPRRSKIVMLPQDFGAAGVVSISFFSQLYELFPVLELKNHNGLPPHVHSASLSELLAAIS